MFSTFLVFVLNTGAALWVAILGSTTAMVAMVVMATITITKVDTTMATRLATMGTTNKAIMDTTSMVETVDTMAMMLMTGVTRTTTWVMRITR